MKARAFHAGMSASAVSSATFISSTDFSPASVAGLALWARSDAGVERDAAGRVDAWRDQSGQANDVVQPTVGARPVLVPGEAGSLPVLRFDGSNDVMHFTSRVSQTIRAVFMVFKEADPAPTWAGVLGDVSTTDFQAGWSQLWYGSGYTSPHILNGQTWLNGAAVNGTATNRPKTMSVLSVLTTGGVTADRVLPGLKGDLAEVILYTQPLTSSQRKSLEDYLVLKYSLYTGTVGSPEFDPNGGTFDQSVDVTLTTPTPGAQIRFTVNGNEPSPDSILYQSAITVTDSITVKARAYRTGMDPSPVSAASFVKTASFSPASVAGLALWARADADVDADAAGRVSVWGDQSGLANDLTQTTVVAQPVRVPAAVNGLPIVRFDGGDDVLRFTNRLSDTIRAVFMVFREADPAPMWAGVLGDVSTTHFSPGWSQLWYGNGYTSPHILAGQTWLNGAAVDGTATNRPKTMSVLSVLTTGGVTADRVLPALKGDLAELIIYDQPLTDAQRKGLEDYLVLKYALYTGTAGAPQFTPNGATFTDTVAVGLTTPTPGAEIRYTLDGTEPTATSDLYSGPLAISQTTTVKARSLRATMTESPVSAASFIRTSDFSPSVVPGLSLWARSDAGLEADAAGRVSVWRDQSGLENHLVQTALISRPVAVPGAVGGLPVVRFDGAGDVMAFTSRLSGTIRAVFMVFKEADPAPMWASVLGDVSSPDFLGGWSQLWYGSGYTSPHILAGQTWLNGVPVDGTAANRPKTMSVLSVLTTGGVTADRVLPTLKGDLAELLIYTELPTNAQRKSLEDYLALKYGLFGGPYVGTVGAPQLTPNGSRFTGSVEVALVSPTPGAEIRYTLDGNDPTDQSDVYEGALTLTATTTVKARAFHAGMSASVVSSATFLRSTDFSPASVAGLALWARSDAGVEGDAAGRVDAWRDQSGLANDVVQPTVVARPVLVPGEAGGLPALRFDGANDVMQFSSRLSGTIRAVFMVFKEAEAAPTWRSVLGDVSSPDFLGGWSQLWYGSGYTSPHILAGQTWLNGVPVDGTVANRPKTMSVLSVLTTGGVTADRVLPTLKGDLAELLIYTEPVSNAQRKSLEDYLALKYGLFGGPYVGTVAAPELTPNGSRFTDSVDVALSSPTPGAEIRYTLDGNDPTDESVLYEGALTLTATTTVKARAFHAGMSASVVSSATFLRSTDFSPASVAGLALWARSDAGVERDAAGRVDTWRDQSGQANHVVQSTVVARPVLVPGGAGGLPVLRFDGSNDVMQFTTRLSGTIRAVFMVFKEATPAPVWRGVLGDPSTTHFSPGWSALWYGDASPHVLSGETWLNGVMVNGTTTNRPKTMSVLSVLTTGGVTADRVLPGLQGDLAEVLIYTEPITSVQRKSLEDYLVLKYAPYTGTAAAPVIAPSGGTFTDTQEVALSSPTPGATIRYTLDGSDPTADSDLYTGPFLLSSTALVQARAFRTGMNASPIALANFVRDTDVSPATIPGLALWARADAGVTADASDRVSVWRDVSGRGNDLMQVTVGAQPTLVPAVAGDLPAVRFDGTDDTVLFTSRLSNIRTVFWVVREDAAAPVAPRFLLGDVSNYHFHAGAARLIWNASYADPAIRNGETRINGALVDGTTTNRPSALSVISLVTTGNVTADAFSRDRSYGNFWVGDLAELIVYDRPLTGAERKAVEDHLALKYALYVPALPAPVFSPNGTVSPVTTIATLRSPLAGVDIRYTTDGSVPTTESNLYEEPLVISTRTTVKARSFREGWAASPIVSAIFLDDETPAPQRVAGLKLWVKADAGLPAPGGTVSSWADQSGNGNHLVQTVAASQPLVVADVANGHPAVRFDGLNDGLLFTNRLTTIRTVFWVVRANPAATTDYRFLLGDVADYHFCSGATTKLWDTSYTSVAIKNGETRLNGALVNGLTTDRPTSLSVISLVTTGNVHADALSRDRTSGRSWWGDVLEVAVYDRPLSEQERAMVEAYLADKYALFTPTVVAPSVNPPGGWLSGSQTVILDAPVPDTTIHYTTDDTEPTEASPEYTGPFEITSTTRLRARAFRDGWNPSSQTVVTFFASDTFTPATVPNLALWVRADAGLAAGAVSSWPDQGPRGNHLSQTSLDLRPQTSFDAASGMLLVDFDGIDDSLSFDARLTTIRTVFWVIRSSSTASAPRFLLGDVTNYDFHGGATTKLWHSGYTSASVRSGVTRIDGLPVDGTTTDRPTDLAVISLVTTGPVSADAFTRDRIYGQVWAGDLGELVIYDRALSEAEVQAVEAYLAARFGIDLAP